MGAMSNSSRALCQRSERRSRPGTWSAARHGAGLLHCTTRSALCRGHAAAAGASRLPRKRGRPQQRWHSALPASCIVHCTRCAVHCARGALTRCPSRSCQAGSHGASRALPSAQRTRFLLSTECADRQRGDELRAQGGGEGELSFGSSRAAPLQRGCMPAVGTGAQ